MKYSNIIVVGGAIAAGKSSLVNSLPYIHVQELDPDDELQKVLLSKMYEGDEIASQVFQLDIMLTRFDKYKKASKTNKTYVFDRMIFEDKLFALMLFGDKKHVWEYYNSIWEDKVHEIIHEIGIPKMYILLSISWDNFKERIFKRNRKAEIENFQKNKLYFKKLLDMYDDFIIKQLNIYKIPYIVVDTNNKNKDEVLLFVKNKLEQKGMFNDK